MDNPESPPKEPKFKFRSYTPQTGFLEGKYTVDKAEPELINQFIQDKLDMITDGSDNYKIDSNKLQPKGDDWDLKRRIKKRLDKLEKETRKSIDQSVKKQSKSG